MRANITTKVLQSLRPRKNPYFIRSTNGFAIKVNPKGTIKFVVEARHKGRTIRKTIGSFPMMQLKEAKEEGAKYLQLILSDQHKARSAITLDGLFSNYISALDLKVSTIQDYQRALPNYLSDWLNIKVSDITKEMVEQRFTTIRDRGWNGGIPTYSQATKVMRILSAVLTFAMADDIIESNPVMVLKQKRVKRSIVKRTNYLTQEEGRRVLDCLSVTSVELAIELMLYTGLRKNEALSIRWTDVTKELITIGDTKNHRPHLIPITERIQQILNRIPSTTSPYLFPSPVNKLNHIKDVRPTLKRIEKRTGISFKCHDLRRTFATRASEVGIDYLMIKRMLNHKTNDITAQYIQWDSKENLQKMREALEKIQY